MLCEGIVMSWIGCILGSNHFRDEFPRFEMPFGYAVCLRPNEKGPEANPCYDGILDLRRETLFREWIRNNRTHGFETDAAMLFQADQKAARKQRADEEAARQRKADEEAAQRQADEKTAMLRADEEAAMQRKAEQEAVLQSKAEEFQEKDECSGSSGSKDDNNPDEPEANKRPEAEKRGPEARISFTRQRRRVIYATTKRQVRLKRLRLAMRGEKGVRETLSLLGNMFVVLCLGLRLFLDNRSLFYWSGP